MIIEIVSIIFCFYGASDYGVHKEVLLKRKKMQGNKHIYLTTIGVYFTIVTMMSSLLSELCFSKSLSILTNDCIVIALSIETYVSIAFWILVFINEDFLRSKSSQGAVIKANFLKEISLHLLPSVFLTVLFFKKQIIFCLRQVFFLNFFVAVYISVVHVFSILNKEYLYPILNRTSPTYRILLASISVVVINLIYFFLNFLNRIK